MASKAITKAVIPAAGLGKRLAPHTFFGPKELVSIGAQPALFHVLRQLAAAGIREVCLVTSADKEPLFRATFQYALGLADRLIDDPEVFKEHAKATSFLRDIEISYVIQAVPRGLGHAVSLAQNFVGSDPFVVRLPDDLLVVDSDVSDAIKAYGHAGGRSIVSLMNVPLSETYRYGIADLGGEQTIGAGQVLEICGLVEKPDVENAPSRAAVMACYVLSPQVFLALEGVAPGSGNEIQLTDALKEMRLMGVAMAGPRLDLGTVRGYELAQKAIGNTGSTRSAWPSERMIETPRRGLDYCH